MCGQFGTAECNLVSCSARSSELVDIGSYFSTVSSYDVLAVNACRHVPDLHSCTNLFHGSGLSQHLVCKWEPPPLLPHDHSAWSPSTSLSGLSDPSPPLLPLGLSDPILLLSGLSDHTHSPSFPSVITPTAYHEEQNVPVCW